MTKAEITERIAQGDEDSRTLFKHGPNGIGKRAISAISGIAARNIKFHIEHSLRGKVEFRGAKKTGGYYVVIESRTKRTKAKKRNP